jgi:3-methyladenine DNA glycosylase AlkD
VLQLRALLAINADPQHAVFHRNYHKSQLHFHGLKSAGLKSLLREVIPARPKRDRSELLPLIAELWQSGCWEETMLALMLLERIEPQLEPGDLPLLHAMTRDCEGWAQLDTLACGIISRMLLRLGEPLYSASAAWIEDEYMWTRRACILLHIMPARKRQLNHNYCWPAWEARLHEKEFFIRKAIGWALREASKQYPQEVHDFLMRVGDRASGLTRREAARNLPETLRRNILAK